VLVAISTLQPFALNVLAPATPGLARSLGTDYATVQLTLTLYLVAVALTQVIIGPISDLVGRRPCILGGIALFAVGSVIGALAEGIGLLLLVRVAQAIGGGICIALSRAVVRDTAERDEAASVLGYVTMAMVVAPMVAPLIGGFLDTHFGWRSIFGVTALVSLPVAGTAMWFLRETAPSNAERSIWQAFQLFPVLLRERVFMGYALAMAFTTAAHFAFMAGAPFAVIDVMGTNATTYGWYSLVIAGGYMAGNFIAGRFGRRLGSRRLVAVGTVASLLSLSVELAILGFGPWTPTTLFFPLTLNAAGSGMIIPGSLASALAAKPHLAGTASGLAGALQLATGAVAATITGHITPLWPPALVLAMAACVIAGAFAFNMARPS
jgi:DHA1 family bicyclomycin/chloramphenicol resistance-like MFS transporter